MHVSNTVVLKPKKPPLPLFPAESVSSTEIYQREGLEDSRLWPAGTAPCHTVTILPVQGRPGKLRQINQKCASVFLDSWMRASMRSAARRRLDRVRISSALAAPCSLPVWALFSGSKWKAADLTLKVEQAAGLSAMNGPAWGIASTLQIVTQPYVAVISSRR